MKNKPWNSPKYQRITDAQIVSEKLEIRFEDNSIVNLDRNSILPVGMHNPDWSNLQFTPYELIVPTSSDEIEIPWSTIRLLSDTSFAAHWALQAEEQAKDIGKRLRELRKSKNLSSKEVAERAGISPQSLSRIEKGHHDVVFTTLRKILAAMGCTLQDLASVQVLPSSVNSLLKRLESAGVRRDWLLERVFPRELEYDLNLDPEDGDSNNTIVDLISKIYSWSKEQILSDRPLSINASLLADMRFKRQGRSQEKHVHAYALYAHYLSLLVVQTVSHLEVKEFPQDADNIKDEIIKRYGPVNLENTLRYIWDHGIPVIPLSDPGAFHGACWKISNRKVIVLKQLTKFQGRWLFDLAHELGHAIKHLDRINSIIEEDEISPVDNDEIETEANDFAFDLLFSRSTTRLAEQAAERANGKVENLKSAVIQIAAEERIPLDLFANYIAYYLSAANNINWWGTANNLQISEPSPFTIAKQVFDETVKIDVLNDEDQQLLLRALEN